MDSLILACSFGFPDQTELVTSLVIYVLAKPLAYFLYVRAFRYRVSALVPMSRRRAMVLAIQRMSIGIFLIGGGALFFYAMASTASMVILGWIYFYGARVAAWWYVGRVGASIRGKRLIGWVIGGMLVNIAFDAAAFFGLLVGWAIPAGIVVVLLVFILILESRGQRASMLARFTEPICTSCQYNLTGNLSGVCPECGTSIDMATLAKIPVSTPSADPGAG